MMPNLSMYVGGYLINVKKMIKNTKEAQKSEVQYSDLMYSKEDQVAYMY
jgi:hypothetical protein